MQVDIDHVLFWMDAIRNSEDRDRTLESFWRGQVKSKMWLIDNLIPFINKENNKIVIHGGWNGILSSLLFQSSIYIEKIISVDIDPSCEKISKTVNKIENMAGKFLSVTCNMSDYDYCYNGKFIRPDIVINTSCEHIDQKEYEKWLSKIPNGSIIVLQSNNYFDLDEHIRCACDLEDFESQSKILAKGKFEIELPNTGYKRFMLIG
jgi:hypothetical protein